MEFDNSSIVYGASCLTLSVSEISQRLYSIYAYFEFVAGLSPLRSTNLGKIASGDLKNLKSRKLPVLDHLLVMVCFCLHNFSFPSSKNI